MSGSHVLITGATGGVGQALALEYAAPGVTRSLCGRSVDRLADIAARCEAKGAVARTARVDMLDTGAVHDWVCAADDFLPVDIGFANAGVSSAIGPDGSGEPLEDVERLFRVNALGTAVTVQPLAERMRARGRGRIVLMSSISALRGFPATPAYSATKAAVRTYGKALRGWLKAYGVQVTVVTMGFVDSPMSDRYVGGKPFRCSAATAASRIRRGLEKDKGEIIFPYILALGTWSLNLFIEPVALWILKTFFHCSVEPDADSPLGGGKR